MRQEKKIDPAVIAAEENLLIDFQFLLQELISSKNVSRTELAELAGLSKARLSQIFSAEANPTVKTMARLAHAMGERIDISRKKEEKLEARQPRPRHSFGWDDVANDNVTILYGNVAA